MKRLIRRTTAAVIGIFLGWYVAGVVPVGELPVVLGPGVSYAGDGQSHYDAPHDTPLLSIALKSSITLI